MTHEYIRQANHSYLILKDESGDAHEASYQLAMLKKCPIDGLLPFSEGHLNDSTVCQYDITSLKPLPVMAEAIPFSEDAIRDILSDLLKTVEMVEDCLLSADHLLLDPNFCYLTSEAGKMALKVPYVPFCHRDIFISLADFSTYLATHAEKGSPDAVVLACRIRHELEEPNVVLNDLKPYLRPEGSEYADAAEDTYGDESAPTGSWDSSKHSDEALTAPANKKLSQRAASEHGGHILHLPAFLTARIPERFTILVALCGIPAAVLIYLLLHLYAFWSMTVAERAGVSAAASALLVMLICMVRRFLLLRQKRKNEPAEPSIFRKDISSPDQPYSQGFSASNGQTTPIPARSAVLPEEEKTVSGGFSDEDDDERTVLLSDYLASKKPANPRLEPETSATHSCPDDFPGTAQSVIAFDRPRFLIGSSEVLCDKIIDDPTVSRIHAEIFEKEGRWYLLDMNSKNGTFLNRTMLPVEKKVPLTDGDAVSFGAAHYIFRER